jgi:hypothetical protein
MPTASAIVLNDGQATPVAHTFQPNQITPQLAVFTNRDSVTSAGQMTLELGFSPASSKRSTERLSVRFNLPIEATVDGVTAVAYTARFLSDIIIPDSMTASQRADLAAFISNAVSDAIVQGMVTDLDPVY